MKRRPRTKPVRRDGGHPVEAVGAPPSRPSASAHEVATAVAHDVNNPLAVIIANLEVFADTISEMRADSGTYRETPRAREWLASHLDEIEVCLHDVRDAAQRIRAVVQRLEQDRKSVV